MTQWLSVPVGDVVDRLAKEVADGMDEFVRRRIEWERARRPKELTPEELEAMRLQREAEEKARAKRRKRHDKLFPDCEGGFDHWCDY